MQSVLRCAFINCAFLFLLFAYSCNKEIHEPPPERPVITGEWIFMSNKVSTETIVSYAKEGVNYKEKLAAEYTTYNNNGMVAITDNSIAGANLRYDIITTLYFTFYIGEDTEEDSSEEPYTFYMDAEYDAQKQFQLIGADSIYFPNGIIMQLTDISGREQTSMSLPQGGRIKQFDNSLVITTSSLREYTYEEDGTTYSVAQKETIGTELAKQF